MARPKADLPPAAAILALAEAVAIEAGRVVVKVRAKPEDGKANAAVLDLLATALGVATSRLRLLRGATGRDKQVQLVAP